MATHTLVYRTTHGSGTFTREIVEQAVKRIKPLLPRPCMMVSVGLLIAGLCIPFLMGLALIPATLFLGLIGMASACTGVVLTLYYM